MIKWRTILLGSSPRVRSRPIPLIGVQIGFEDHLRVCGADPDLQTGTELIEGSSPRVRSRRRQRR